MRASFLKCWSLIDANKKLFSIKSRRALKHVDAVSSVGVTRKGKGSDTILDFGKSFLPSAQFLPPAAMFQRHMTTP